MTDNVEAQALRQLYYDAESFAKEVSEFSTSVAIPSHNELRYATNHILKSMDAATGTLANQGELRKAKSHCERAMYEAAESGITTALTLIADFQREFNDLVIGDVVQGYTEMCATAERVKRLMVKGRSGRNSVQEHVHDYMAAFRELVAIVHALTGATGDLNAKRRKDATSFRRQVGIASLGLLGTAALLLGRACIPPPAG